MQCTENNANAMQPLDNIAKPQRKERNRGIKLAATYEINNQETTPARHAKQAPPFPLKNRGLTSASKTKKDSWRKSTKLTHHLVRKKKDLSSLAKGMSIESNGFRAHERPAHHHGRKTMRSV
jgi:hypothetical protein